MTTTTNILDREPFTPIDTSPPSTSTPSTKTSTQKTSTTDPLADAALALLICTPDGVAFAPAKTHKLCTKCGVNHPITKYNREKKKADGFSAWCKACKSKDQTKRRVEKLQHDPDWQLRRKTFAKLARLIAAGEVTKPACCPWCGKAPKAREIQAFFADAADARSVIWRCRACALAQSGKAQLTVCRWCQEPFAVQRTSLRRGGGRYCTVRCRNAWMKATAEHVKDVPVDARATAESVFLSDRF